MALRYRVTVSQDGIEEDALASLLKTRLSFKSGDYQGLKLYVEVDDVTAIGEENYNSTGNGNSEYPVVADPLGTEVNQAKLEYSSGEFTFTGGRQRILHDNQRFVGGVAWRQNEQTYDGYRLQFGKTAPFKFDYSFVYNVNRIFGENSPNSDLDGQLHLVNASYKVAEGHKVSGFAYLYDFENAWRSLLKQ